MQRLGLIDEKDMLLSETWTTMLAPLTAHQRINQKRVARFCDQRGLAPDQVSSDSHEAFKAHPVFRTLTPSPPKLAGDTRAQWNKFAQSVVGSPQTLLTKPVDPLQYTLPLDDFPESFQDDLKAFGKHLFASVLDDPLGEDLAFDDSADDEAPLPNSKPLCANSVNNRLDHARWAASVLKATGVPLAEIVDLRSLVQPINRARLILQYLHQRAGKVPSATGQHVSDVLRIIARHYVHASLPDIAKITHWSKPVQLHYKGMTEKNERTVREILMPAREVKLLQLPDALMKAARKLQEKSPVAAARLAWRAVAIEILTRLPLRLQNLIDLRLDQHLHRADLRDGTIAYIDIPAAEVKNNRSLSMPVPAVMAALMTEWIDVFQPALAAFGSPYLFPGADTATKPITPQAMSDAVKKVTQDHLGVTVSPHQFRHLAARQFLREFPRHYEEIRQILGHATTETTMRSYAGIESESAIRRQDEVLTNRLKALGLQRRTVTKRR